MAHKLQDFCSACNYSTVAKLRLKFGDKSSFVCILFCFVFVLVLFVFFNSICLCFLRVFFVLFCWVFFVFLRKNKKKTIHSYKIALYNEIQGAFNRFPDFFVLAFKIVIDS